MGVKNVTGLMKDMDRNKDGKVTFNEFTLYMIYKHFVPHLKDACVAGIDQEEHFHAIIDKTEKVDEEKVDFIDDEPIEDEEAMPEEMKEMNHKQQQR